MVGSRWDRGGNGAGSWWDRGGCERWYGLAVMVGVGRRGAGGVVRAARRRWVRADNGPGDVSLGAWNCARWRQLCAV